MRGKENVASEEAQAPGGASSATEEGLEPAQVVCTPARATYLQAIMATVFALMALSLAAVEFYEFASGPGPASQKRLQDGTVFLVVGLVSAGFALFCIRASRSRLVGRERALEIRRIWRSRIIEYEGIRRCKIDRDSSYTIAYPARFTLVVDTREQGILRFLSRSWNAGQLRELGMFIRARLRRLPPRGEPRAEARGGDEQ